MADALPQTFRGYVDPDAKDIAHVAASAPTNPFHTPEYVTAQREIGARPCVLAVEDGGHTSACIAFLLGGRISRTLEIPSVPTLPDGSADAFWTGVERFAASHGVWDVEVQSYASAESTLRPIGTTTWQRTRVEYVLHLQEPAGLPKIASNHARNVSRARKLGLVVERSRDPDRVQSHVALMNESMQRRADRGESVPRTHDPAPLAALLRAGAAELFQALDGPETRSSMLVLRATDGAYYHSAGTTQLGMEQGASHFLIAEISRILREEGLRVFNLGGAGPESGGLQRFKLGFGAVPVELQAASFALRSAVLRKARTALRLTRSEPSAVVRALIRIDRFVVFDADPADLTTHDPAIPAVEVRRLTDDEVRALDGKDPEFANHARRFARLGYHDAYGTFIDGELAHVAWLVTPDRDRLATIRHVKLRDGEAEITHCVTAPEHRGRGIYPATIRALSGVAAHRGVRRVIMITNVANIASQRGIEKAGLHRAGRIVHVNIPPLGDRASIVWRGHRWPR